MDAVEGIVELANKADAGSGRLMTALGLLHLDVRNNIGVEERRDDVHLFDLEVMVACEGKKDAKCCVPFRRGEYGGVVEVLHVAVGDEAGLVLDDGA